jgi:hypothetical protein
MADRPGEELSAVLYQRLLALLGRDDAEAIPALEDALDQTKSAWLRSAGNAKRRSEHSNGSQSRKARSNSSPAGSASCTLSAPNATCSRRCVQASRSS